ncbi:UNVERIFIED_CONTAM: hypothetical protein FKN15_035884 [Acipenser sinensis]
MLAVLLEQPQSVTKSKDKNMVRLNCKVSGVNLDTVYIHWYRHRSNEAHGRILYYSSTTRTVYDTGFTEEKYVAERVGDVFTLVLHEITETDSAYYHCAVWTTTLI